MKIRTNDPVACLDTTGTCQCDQCRASRAARDRNDRLIRAGYEAVVEDYLSTHPTAERAEAERAANWFLYS